MDDISANPLAVSFALIFLAELGDKTQLIALAFATRYRMTAVLAGAAAGTLLVTGFSVGIGASIGQFLPEHWLKIATGSLLIVFALVMVRGYEEDESETRWNLGRFGPVLAVAITFFVAEIGDKTMIATMGLAAQSQAYFLVWAGASGGMILANLVGITVGRLAGKRLPERMIRWIAATLFFASGVVILIEGIRSARLQ
ncbi:MAG: TMEM165/GDT1 family protein [Acidobacteria bacterium]|nr:TMEM165/GDT1 family protein [Acidobacteriota bacterium]